MAEMDPRTYANQYWDMKVPIINDDNETVRYDDVLFNKYRLFGGWFKKPAEFPPGHLNFLSVTSSYAAKFFKQKKSILLKVKNVWGDNLDISVSNDLELKAVQRRAVQAFSGKGSPEDVQLTLQLAARTGIATKGLQEYCDEKVDTYARLGLDCNGFVGNYLYHRKDSKKWNLNPPDDSVINSTTRIRDMMGLNGTEVITSVDQMRNCNIFLMGLVDNSDTVINQVDSNGRAGHVVITEALTWGDRPLYPPAPKSYLNSDVRYLHYLIIESTPGVGLSSGVYAILNITTAGVATVWRSNVNSLMRVKIYQLR